MTKISFRPFRAYRPRNDIASTLTCEPYNKSSLQEIRNKPTEQQTSFIHVIKPEANLNQPVKQYDKQAGAKGGQSLTQLIASGYLVQDASPSFYVYGQEKGGLKHLCMIGELAVQNYHDGLIKGHESTIEEKELALEQFTCAQNAHTDPILLTYRSNGHIKSFMQKIAETLPSQQFTSQEGITHSAWQINNPDILSTLQDYFSRIPTLYIADGHHRSAVAQRMHKNSPVGHPHQHLLAAISPDSFVQLADYNRIIKDLNGLIPETFLEKLTQHFTVKSTANPIPKKPHSFGMFLHQTWYMITTKKQELKKRTSPHSRIDMTLLNELILKPLLAIDNLYDNSRIECVGGLFNEKELEEKCRSQKWQLAFALHPVPMESFMQVVDSGQLMPAKTTWFEPKMRPGLFVRMMNT